MALLLRRRRDGQQQQPRHFPRRWHAAGVPPPRPRSGWPPPAFSTPFYLGSIFTASRSGPHTLLCKHTLSRRSREAGSWARVDRQAIAPPKVLLPPGWLCSLTYPPPHRMCNELLLKLTHCAGEAAGLHSGNPRMSRMPVGLKHLPTLHIPLRACGRSRRVTRRPTRRGRAPWGDSGR